MWRYQCALVVSNCIFAMTGLIVFIFGCLVRFGSSYIEDFMSQSISSYSTLTRPAGSENKRMKLNLEDYLVTGSYILMGIGASFLAVSFFGCCVSLRKMRCILTCYAVLVTLLIVAEISVTVIVTAFPEKVTEIIKAPMYTSLRKEYKGINSSDVISVGWNSLMTALQCCGVVNSKDFSAAEKWNKKITVSGQPINGSLTLAAPPITLVLTTPVACCKMIGYFPQITLVDANNITCAISPNEMNSNMNYGCAESIMKKIQGIDIYIAVVASVLVLLKVVILILVIQLVEAIKRHNNDDKELQSMFTDD